MYKIKEVNTALWEWAKRSKQRKEFKIGLFDDLKSMFETYVTPIKTRKFKIGRTKALLTEASRTPLIIRQAYFPVLTSLILDMLGGIEELQAFERIQIRFIDNWPMTTNLAEWFRRMFLSWHKQVCVTKSIANVIPGEEEIIINVEADSILGIISLGVVFPGRTSEQVCEQRSEMSMPPEEIEDKISRIIEKIKSPAGSAEIKSMLDRIIIHELTHKIHEKRQPGILEGKNVEWLNLIIKTGLFDKTLRCEELTAREQLASTLLRLRSALATFHANLLIEGMAVYAEKKASDFNEWERFQGAWQKFMPEFKKSYDSLLDSMKKAIDNFDSHSEEENKKQAYSLGRQNEFFCNKMWEFTYNIGLHMIKTLSFFPVDIFNLNLKQFYQLYEDICIDKLKIRPLVSAGSNSGMIDIIQMSKDEEALLKYFVNIETGKLIEKPLQTGKAQKITSS